MNNSNDAYQRFEDEIKEYIEQEDGEPWHLDLWDECYHTLNKLPPSITQLKSLSGLNLINTQISDLSELKSAQKQVSTNTVDQKAPIADKKPIEPQIDSLGRTYATGKRKDAIARVWIKPGKGKIIVNGKDYSEYFKRAVLRMIIEQPFGIAQREAQYDVFSTVTGGGLSGQAGALKHGLSKALNLREPELRTTLKAAGFLTRDSRVVERKKYGLRKARRSPQFSKR